MFQSKGSNAPCWLPPPSCPSLKEPLFPQISLTGSKLLLVYVWKWHRKGEATSLKVSTQMGTKWCLNTPRIWAMFLCVCVFFFYHEILNCKPPIYIYVRICTRGYIKLSVTLHSNAASEEVNLSKYFIWEISFLFIKPKTWFKI